MIFSLIEGTWLVLLFIVNYFGFLKSLNLRFYYSSFSI
uniref:Uncharacterized protein n=1 Tax=Manihot esculenta TaxID=3983 RepID=A0A2C9UQ26_MANES